MSKQRSVSIWWCRKALETAMVQERESLEGTFRQRCGMKLKGTAPVMNRIGSELTLDLGEPTFRPDVCVTRQGSRLTSLTAFQGSLVLAVVLWFLSSLSPRWKLFCNEGPRSVEDPEHSGKKEGQGHSENRCRASPSNVGLRALWY